MTKVNIAVIGAGNWGQNLIRVCHELDVLISIFDHGNSNAIKLSKQYNIPINSWQNILEDVNVTAVVIALPAILHAEYAMQALQANKHVFIEKPLAMSVVDAVKLNSLAVQYNKVLMVGHILHYHNAFRKLKELVACGEIGDVRYIESIRVHMGPLRYDAGIIWELLPHDASMILDICRSSIKSLSVSEQLIYCESKENNLNGDVIDVNITFNNGILAKIHSSWLYPKKEQKFSVLGTRGSIIFEDTAIWSNKLKMYKYNTSPTVSNKIAKEVLIPLEEAEPLKTEMTHFIDAITQNLIPYTNAQEGLAVVSLLQTIENKLKITKHTDLVINNIV